MGGWPVRGLCNGLIEARFFMVDVFEGPVKGQGKLCMGIRPMNSSLYCLNCCAFVLLAVSKHEGKPIVGGLCCTLNNFLSLEGLEAKNVLEGTYGACRACVRPLLDD